MNYYRFDTPGFYVCDQSLKVFAAAVPACLIRITVELDFCGAFIPCIGFRPIRLDFQGVAVALRLFTGETGVDSSGIYMLSLFNLVKFRVDQEFEVFE